MSPSIPIWTKAATWLCLPVILSACASFSRDGGMDEVRSLTRPHLAQELPSNTGAESSH